MTQSSNTKEQVTAKRAALLNSISAASAAQRARFPAVQFA